MTPHPPIVAPVSRSIFAADAARAADFFRDVLGFEIRRHNQGDVEAVSGPASIHLGNYQLSAMLFFETADLAAMHAAIRERGGSPGDLAKINWVKMQVFTVPAPDGHTIWFGQSYGGPDNLPERPMLRQALPCLPHTDVAAGVKHYVDVFGFRINYQQADLGVLDRDAITVLLPLRREHDKGIASAYFYVENADKLYADLRARGADLRGEPVSHPWGLRDFLVVDREGNELRFGQPFE